MSAVPVIFIHGLWLHADSWQPWVEQFTTAGYTATAPLWPGEKRSVEGTRQAGHDLAGLTIDQVTSHYIELIGSLETKPVVIGHSFGGLIAQKLLAAGHAQAAVAIDPAGIKGVKPLPLSQLRSAWPVLTNPGNRTKAVSLTTSQFRYAFGNAIPAAESDALHTKFSIPAPGRMLFQAASANFDRQSEAFVDVRAARGPLLLIAGGKDHTVPEVVVRAAHKLYTDSPATTELRTFPDRGHSLVIDQGWRAIADEALAWVRTTTIAL